MDLHSIASTLDIERPRIQDLFSWSDFPAIRDNTNYLKTLATASSDLPPLMEICMSSDEDSSSFSLCSISDDDDDEVESIAASTAMVDTSSAATTSSATTTSKRRVRFASSIQIRTYSIVVGDHPLCEALPMCLGWKYDPQEAVVDLETHEDSKRMVQGGYYGHSSLAAAAHGVHRLSYLERKYLLLQVGGYTPEELDRISSFSMRLKHSKRSSPDLCLREKQEFFFAATADV